MSKKGLIITRSAVRVRLQPPPKKIGARAPIFFRTPQGVTRLGLPRSSGGQVAHSEQGPSGACAAAVGVASHAPVRVCSSD